MEQITIPSFLGPVQIKWSEKGLEHIDINLAAKPSPLNPENLPEWLVQFCQDLVNYLDHAQPFSKWPLINSEKWTDFQTQIYKELFRTQKGETLSYGELAKRCNKPDAARAVGSAMSKNKLPILIPCHRVLPANKKLGNYSGGEGPLSKQKLLDFEQAHLDT